MHSTHPHSDHRLEKAGSCGEPIVVVIDIFVVFGVVIGECVGCDALDLCTITKVSHCAHIYYHLLNDQSPVIPVCNHQWRVCVRRERGMHLSYY